MVPIQYENINNLEELKKKLKFGNLLPVPANYVFDSNVLF